jgi:hypothetical protein
VLIAFVGLKYFMMPVRLGLGCGVTIGTANLSISVTLAIEVTSEVARLFSGGESSSELPAFRLP